MSEISNVEIWTLVVAIINLLFIIIYSILMLQFYKNENKYQTNNYWFRSIIKLESILIIFSEIIAKYNNLNKRNIHEYFINIKENIVDNIKLFNIDLYNQLEDLNEYYLDTIMESILKGSKPYIQVNLLKEYKLKLIQSLHSYEIKKYKKFL